MRRALPVIGGLLLGLGLGIIVFFGLLKPEVIPNMSGLSTGAESPSVPYVDAPAPVFELNNLAGEQIRLEDYRGKIVLLNFWATWCGPCRLEMPALQSRAEHLEDDLVVLAVNNAEDSSVIQAFVDELGLSIGILLDPDAEVQHLYQVRAYPTTFLIDTEGIIRAQKIGLLTESALDGYLLELGAVK